MILKSQNNQNKQLENRLPRAVIEKKKSMTKKLAIGSHLYSIM